MNNAIREPLMVAGAQNRIRLGHQPRNATSSPCVEESEGIRSYLYVQYKQKTRLIPERLDRHPPGRKSGTEPGWLPDDDLTREWLSYVEEYRSECDAADREEPPSNGVAGEGAS